MENLDLFNIFRESDGFSCTEEQIRVIDFLLENPNEAENYIDDLVRILNKLDVLDGLDDDLVMILENVINTELFINSVLDNLDVYENSLFDWYNMIFENKDIKYVYKYINNNKVNNFNIFNNIVNYYLNYFKEKDNCNSMYEEKRNNLIKILRYLSKIGINSRGEDIKINRMKFKKIETLSISEYEENLLRSVEIEDLKVFVNI